jgi:hypothetical protein
MGNRFVRPDTVRLDISAGDWLEVKRRLTAGEQRQAFARIIKTAGGSAVASSVDGAPPEVHADIQVHPAQVGLSQVLAYLVDWSLTDADGKPVVIRGKSLQVVSSALDALDMESYQEIEQAIRTHEAAMLQERTQEKKVTSGASASSVISPSPSDVTGRMSMSPS